jgi:hypothetical protein
MAIGDDTSIDYTNKIIDVTGTTVYDVSVLYSYCKEQFKLSANIDDDFAWTANTAVDYTLKNGWVLRARSIRRLKNGGIRTVYGLDQIEKLEFAAGGYTNAIDSDIGKVVVGTGLDGDDVLVDFDNTKRVWYVRTGDATSVADSTAITITAGTGAGTTTGSSVGSTAGEDDLWTNINTIGDLAATGPQPLIYVYTGDLTTGDFNGNARRNETFDDDPDPSLTNSDRGVFDGLIRIKDMGTTLGNPAGEVRVYGRQGLDKFADFPIDITAGGRIAVPIGQSNDTEDTIGEVAVAGDAATQTDFTVGEVVTWTGTNSAEVVEHIEVLNGTGADGVKVLKLRGLTAYPADGTTLTGATSGATMVTRGEVGGILLSYDAETNPITDPTDFGVLLTGGTSGATMTIRGATTVAEATGTLGYLIAETRHDSQAFPTDYTTPVDNDNFTGTGVDITADFVTAGFKNERLCYDLDDVQLKLAAWDLTVADSSGFIAGQNVTQTVTGAKGTVISVPDSTSIIVSQNNQTVFTGANVLNDDDGAATETITGAARTQTFGLTLPLQSSVNYNGLINCNGRTAAETFHYIKYFQQARATSANTDPNALNADPDYDRELIMLKEELGAGGLIFQVVQGEEYFRAVTDEDTPANNPTDQSPDSRIAVKPGTSITTGQGWALINIASADANNYTLTGADGSKNTPLASVNVTLSNLVSGYHVQVALDDGTGQEELAQFNVAAAGNTAGDADLVIDEVLPNDTPTGGGGHDGIVKVVDTDSVSPENRELRYRYSSYATSTFTFVAGETGLTTSEDASPTNTLKDTGAFAATTIKVGDVIRNTTDLSYAWVKEIVDNDTLLTTPLEGGTDDNWQSGDGWATNVLAYTHDGGETCYVPYMDRVADAGTETETITFTSNRNVVIRVRDTSIVDFDTTGTIDNTGISVGAVQNPDNIYAAT